jgi:Fe2+ or Zn2+ uptake regulation protein
MSSMTELALPPGTRVTPQRRAVLDAIDASHGPFTAVELFERARRAQPRVGLATPYRTM